MTHLKAFVGHSFSEEDKEVVTPFLEFFNNIKDMDIGFTWDSARPAEPKELAQKVLALVEDKNLFIGICTKKERVILSGMLKKLFPFWPKLIGNEKDFQWKTSDWLIQEIGMAMGRGMNVILLLEENLRRPGGLQGDIEYIEFSRQAPGDSFNKILEMIRSLIPKVKLSTLEPINRPTQPEEQKDGTQEQSGDALLPDSEWDLDIYNIALSHVIRIGDNERKEKIISAFEDTPFAKDEASKIIFQATHEYCKIRYGKGGSLTQLENLRTKLPQNGEIICYLAQTYKSFGEEIKAAGLFVDAANCEAEIKSKLRNWGQAAISYAQGNDLAKCNDVVKQIKKEANNIGDTEVIVLEALSELAKLQNDQDSYLAITERLLEIRPDDHYVRFQLAYSYSENNQQKLALYHYLKIPRLERSGVAWNNLGVSRQRLNMDCLAVDAYRKSADLGETLAMSNLANTFLGAGFSTEADEICTRAISKKDFHQNVGDSISKINRLREAENEKENEVLTEAKKYCEFYKKYGRAATKVEPPKTTGTWKERRCNLNLKIENRKLIAEGHYQRKNLPSPLATLGSLGSSPLLLGEQTEKIFVRYEGELIGYAVKGHISVGSVVKGGGEIEETETLGKKGKQNEVLMVISDDSQEIRVFEKEAAETYRFYSINKIEG